MSANRLIVKALFHAALCALAAFSAAAKTTYPLTGHVTDESGASIAKATVWLAQDNHVRTAATDSDGAFTFDAVVGRGSLVAQREGHALGGTGVLVTGAASADIVLKKPGTARLRVFGPVEGEGDLPVAGAQVTGILVHGAFHIPVAVLLDHGFPSLRSGAEGRIEIPDLPEKAGVAVMLAHRGYADTEAPYVPVGMQEIPVKMLPGFVARGRVTDTAGEGVAEARVVFLTPGRQGPRVVKEVCTDKEGFYRGTVPFGPVLLGARHPGYASPMPRRLALSGSAEETGLDVVMPEAHPITGAVVGPGGDPLAGVLVGYLRDGVVCDEAFTSVEGDFTLRGAEGLGYVHVDLPPGFIAEEPDGVEVSISSEDETRQLRPIRLKKLPAITGAVHDIDGEPVAGALVVIRGLDPVPWTLSDAHGDFQIAAPWQFSGRPLTLRVEHPRRFQRFETHFDLRNPAPVMAKLERYVPDVHPCIPGHVRNDMAALRGEPAPAITCDHWFNLPDGGDELTLEALRGKVVVLTLWSGWAGRTAVPMELQELGALHAAFEAVDDVAFVGVHACATELDEIQGYIEQYGIRFPVGRDAEHFPTFDAYAINVTPQTVLIDKEGVLRFYEVGGRLVELIKALRRG